MEKKLENVVLEMISTGLMKAKELVGPHFLNLIKYLEYEQDDIFKFEKSKHGYTFTYLERIDLQTMHEHHLEANPCNGKWSVNNMDLPFDEWTKDHTVERTNLFEAIQEYIRVERMLHEQGIVLSSDTACITRIKTVNPPWLKDNQIYGYFSVYCRGKEHTFLFDKTIGESLKLTECNESNLHEKSHWSIGDMIFYKLSGHKIKILCSIPKEAWIFKDHFLYSKRISMTFTREDSKLCLRVSRLDRRLKDGVFSNVNFIEEIDKAVNAINKNENGRGFILYIKIDDPYFVLKKQQLMSHIRETGCEAEIVLN